jgi:hypothetical protein
MSGATHSISKPYVLIVPSKSFYSNQNKPYIRVAFNEYSFYKQKSYWKT